MSGKRIICTCMVSAMLAVALGVSGAAARSSHRLATPHGATKVAAVAPMPDWRTGLLLRSEALNGRYGLGQDALRPAGLARRLAWAQGLLLRSDALNRLYGLGKYAKTGTNTAAPQTR
ncbi:MAG TPA: hypothetical protein VFD90_09355 [Gaiellales bacterium]|jgi:hypothetical protein|nr:hypothetical protein [Gaiellales bacterium]